jgi:hypothetical protein
MCVCGRITVESYIGYFKLYKGTKSPDCRYIADIKPLISLLEGRESENAVLVLMIRAVRS